MEGAQYACYSIVWEIVVRSGLIDGNYWLLTTRFFIEKLMGTGKHPSEILRAPIPNFSVSASA